MNKNPIHDLYYRIKRDTGFSRHYIKKIILPDWWDDRIARSPAGFAQACGYIASRTGLKLEELRGDGVIVMPKI